MDITWKVLIGILLATLAVAAWMLRWDVVPVAGGEYDGSAYMLDRFTGKIYFLHSIERYPVIDKELP